MQVLSMLDLPKGDMALLATKPEAARIHVTAMGLHLQPEALSEKISKSRHWSHAVAFRPTGIHSTLHPHIDHTCLMLFSCNAVPHKTFLQRVLLAEHLSIHAPHHILDLACANICSCIVHAPFLR